MFEENYIDFFSNQQEISIYFTKLDTFYIEAVHYKILRIKHVKSVDYKRK